jgi:hypothetical protein
MTNTPTRGIDRPHRRVIFASSLGTVFEWYDFYLYGSLAAVISKQFFAGVNETTAFIFALLAFAAGFAVRPFGAIVFGRLGDMVGRKYTFLITIVIMGLSTAIVGILPGYATIGVAAPVILVTLRLLQGLALGGEYGGACRLRGGARSRGKARPVHELDPDHSDARAVPESSRHPRLPHDARRCVREAGAGAYRSCCRSCSSPFRCTSGCSSTNRRYSRR